jgi:ABC-2 type transport system ATP-binding protein
MAMSTPSPSQAPTAAPGVTAGPAAVEMIGLTKRFGQVTAVDNLSLTIRPGEIVAFLGPNGAGKTTTIDMMLGLGRPTAGTVEVFGLSPVEAIVAGRVAAVMQTGGLLKDLSVAETVRMTASLYGRARPVGEVLARAGLTGIADRRVGKCSGGQQQRLRFAMALLPDPDLLVLDEPTTGMDVEGRRDFWSAIRADADRGRTVLFATHYLEEADAYADRIVLVRSGRIVADGTAAQIKNLASGRIVRATLPGVGTTETLALAALPGVDTVDVRGDSVTVHASDSDVVARYLLTSTGARDLEITSRNLEEAFLALTTAPEETAR